MNQSPLKLFDPKSHLNSILFPCQCCFFFFLQKGCKLFCDPFISTNFTTLFQCFKHGTMREFLKYIAERSLYLGECRQRVPHFSAQTRNNFVSTKQEVEKLMKRIRSADQDYKPPGQWTMEGFLYVQEKRESSSRGSGPSRLSQSPPSFMSACFYIHHHKHVLGSPWPLQKTSSHTKLIIYPVYTFSLICSQTRACACACVAGVAPNDRFLSAVINNV